MSNKLKRKAKKKTFDFGEYTISLPSGTMLESFIKYTAEEPWNIDRVTDFLDAHSARVRKKVEKNQSFSQQEIGALPRSTFIRPTRLSSLSCSVA